MSSFPKHSFEQAYDHAFPPSPPNRNYNSSTPSRITSPAHDHSTNNYNYNNNSLTAVTPDLSTISERSPLITKAPIQERTSSYTSIDNNSNKYGDDEDIYGPNNHGHGTSVASADTLLEQGDTSCSGEYMSIHDLTVREFKILLRYSGPVVLTYVLQNSLQLASLVSLGHLGSIGKIFHSICRCTQTSTPPFCFGRSQWHWKQSKQLRSCCIHLFIQTYPSIQSCSYYLTTNR
jgi:MATE family multidrug resistance protein